MTFHLRSIRIRPFPDDRLTQYPFNVPALAELSELVLTSPVTCLVGENGSGKSTFLEALALEIGAYTVGSEGAERDATLQPVRALSQHLQLIWSARTRDGFFLRAEDFFGYVKRLAQMEAELLAELARVDREYVGRSEKAKGLARMPYLTELHAMREQYGRHLNNFSHGESFLELFQARFRPNSLYLLDEPETPLSPMRQLTLLSMMKQMVAEKCQFIVATHSPILLAYPEATILSFDERPLAPVPYETLEHVTIMRSFLQNPDAYIRHL